jgi:hypothetical protein
MGGPTAHDPSRPARSSIKPSCPAVILTKVSRGPAKLLATAAMAVVTGAAAKVLGGVALAAWGPALQREIAAVGGLPWGDWFSSLWPLLVAVYVVAAELVLIAKLSEVDEQWRRVPIGLLLATLPVLILYGVVVLAFRIMVPLAQAASDVSDIVLDANDARSRRLQDRRDRAALARSSALIAIQRCAPPPTRRRRRAAQRQASGRLSAR